MNGERCWGNEVRKGSAGTQTPNDMFQSEKTMDLKKRRQFFKGRSNAKVKLCKREDMTQRPK